jgi:parvulin-like peptidyl-prolyl isomerase
MMPVPSLLLKPISFCFFLFLTAGCQQQKSTPLQATVALVNDEAVSLQELRALIPQSEGKKTQEMTPSDGEQEELKRRLLDQLIERKMLLQEARRLKIELTEREVQERFEEARDGKDEAAFSEFLTDRKLTKEGWEKATRENLLIERLLNQLAGEQLSISEGEMRQYYGTHHEEWRVDEQIKLRQIVVKTESEAEALRKTISDGADFAQTARLHSQFPQLGDGGDLGYLSHSEIPVEFDPLLHAEIGSVSPVIQTPFGYHLVKIEGRLPVRTLSFEEVREKIHQTLLEEKRELLFTQWIEKVRRTTEIKINEELLHKLS